MDEAAAPARRGSGSTVLRWLVFACGASIGVLAVRAEKLHVPDTCLGTVQVVLAALSFLFCAAAFLLPRLPEAIRGTALAGSVFVLMIGTLEGGCRLVGIDLSGGLAAWNALPIYYRQPVVSMDGAFFRRSGPAQWTGRVITTGAQATRAEIGDSYATERPITATYDADGFRNPDDLSDWKIVVAGDSFTELGYLPYEDLFTTRLGAGLGCKVKNLGVSYTGTLTQSKYLQHFGKSPSTTDAVCVFFEGNDIADVLSELQCQADFAASGVPLQRDLGACRDTSMLRMVVRSIVRWTARTAPLESTLQGWFLDEGSRVGVALGGGPPQRSELSEEKLNALRLALDTWERTCRDVGLRPWLMLMPCKRRILDGFVEFAPGAPASVRNWRGSDLPEFIRTECAARNIRFIDPAPALVEETRKGRLTYNGVFETHLNRRGSLIVGQVLTDAMRE